MFKVLSAIIATVLIGYIAYMQFVEKKPIDARASIDKQVTELRKTQKLSGNEEELLRLQLAVLSYVSANQRPPSNLGQLVPKYLDRIPKDPASGKVYAYKRDGNRYQIGQPKEEATQVASVPSESGSGVSALPTVEGTDEAVFVNPNTMKPEEFRYDSTDKRDPFVVFDFSQRGKKGGASPLENYDLGQLRVTAIIRDLNGDRKAIVEDSAGRGYTVSKGTRIGLNGGVVVTIEENSLKVLETEIDIAGRESQKVVEMRIYAGGSN
jgi:Tfp pilus assembly protein PilP